MKEEKENQKLEKASGNTKNKIIKVKEHRNFVVVYDSVYKNTSLTCNEGWLLIKLISASPTFEPTHRKLQTILKLSERALQIATKSLQQKGYLKIVKHGRKSEWIVNQAPTVNLVKDLEINTMVKGLLDFDITMEQIYQLHRMKYIDDTVFNKVRAEYGKEMIRIAKTEWLKD